MGVGTLQRDPVAATDEGDVQAVKTLERLLNDNTMGQTQIVAPSGERLDIPKPVYKALRQLMPLLMQGDAVALVPLHKELSTFEAAELLNISRPSAIKLLDEGVIPYTMAGTHRRIRLRDVLAYKEHQDAQRRDALARLTRLSQELGLYE